MGEIHRESMDNTGRISAIGGMKRLVRKLVGLAGLRPVVAALREFWNRGTVRRAARAARGRIAHYLASTASPRLQIGASSHLLEGWLNSDINLHVPELVYLDCLRPFPVGDEAFDYVYCEHFIEHLDRAGGLACMREVSRCLKRGGVFRIATPDLERFLGLFAAQRTAEQDRYLVQFATLLGLDRVTPGEVLNLVMREWGHRHIYSRADLKKALLASGFSQVVDVEVGESAHEALRGIERHQAYAGEESNRFETMVVEATK